MGYNPKNGEFNGVSITGDVWWLYEELMERPKFKNMSEEDKQQVKEIFEEAERTGVMPQGVLLEYAMPSLDKPVPQEDLENLGRNVKIDIPPRFR